MVEQAGYRENTHFRLIDELVDRITAAQMLGVSPRTLDRWHLLRIGPPRITLGRQVRYRVSALEAWILKQEVEPIRTAAAAMAGALAQRS